MKFTKMHGISNDYVYVNGKTERVDHPDEVAVKVSNRHTGVGSDGLVLILPPTEGSGCDFRMRMFNADGTEAEMCGNASRCVGKYVYDKGLTAKTNLLLETKSGVKGLTLHLKDRTVDSVTVDMGEPILTPALIPVNLPMDKVVAQPIVVFGKQYQFTAVSMGNPHAVIFMEGVDALPIAKVGPAFELHPLFPQRTNTEFAQVLDPRTIHMRVWERGAGETMACGTGACATAVAAVLNGLCQREVQLQLLGGDLQIEWRESNNHVYMTGGATTVFEGEIKI